MTTAVPRILDPRAIAVVGCDAHLPAVSAERLGRAALRERFAHIQGFEAPIRGDGAAFTDRPAARAAVLMGLVDRPQGPQVLLTRRTEHLRDHAGQVSFPGGRCEHRDASPEATALREAHEEVGLDAGCIECIGRLPTYTTVTRFEVTPVVALLEPPLALALDAGEVAEAFEVPLAFLMDPAHHQRHLFVHEGGQRQFLSMPWVDPATGREHYIWGATAAMLRNLYHFLAAG